MVSTVGTKNPTDPERSVKFSERISIHLSLCLFFNPASEKGATCLSFIEYRNTRRRK